MLHSASMGYSHYWHRPETVPDALWDRIRSDFDKLVLPLSDAGVVAGSAPAGPIVQEPPFLCIEILSPSDRMAEMQERIDDYLSFGVRYVWLIHPRTRRAFVYTSERVLEVKDGVLRTDGPDICVPLAELE